MAFLVKLNFPGCLNCVEATYAEHVRIVDGRGLCEQRGTADYLMKIGYDVVRELPPLEDLAEQEPALAVELARMGLGPLAGRSAAELDALAQEHA